MATGTMSLSNIILNNLAVGYGDYVISAYGVARYNFGAGKIKRMLSALKFTIISGTCLCLVLLVSFFWRTPAFVRAFTSDAQIIEVGVSFLRAYAWVVPFMALQMSMMCTFQATGSAVRAMVVNLGRQCLFNIPFLYLFNSLWGITGLLYAQTGADICTTILGVLIGIPLLHRLREMQVQEVSLSSCSI